MKSLPTISSEEADEALAEVNKQILERFLEIDGKGNFVNSPKNDDELHLFIQLAFGVTIPRKAVIEGHKAPFEFVADLFFERVKNAVAFANRTGGKTYNVAILNFCDMLFKPGCEVAHGGATKVQANQCYKYFRDFLELSWFKDFCRRYQSTTGKEVFVIKDNKDASEFANKSEQTIIVSSEKGLRSPHPMKARLDEVDLIEWEILLTGLSMARNHPNGKIRGQNVFTSTRQNEHGSMQKLLDDAANKGIKVYEWNIWDVLKKCPRKCHDDPQFGNCPIYTFCQGRAHDSEGFYDIDDFIDKVRLLDRERFEIEWENKRPSRARMVYPMLDQARHWMDREKLYKLTGHTVPQRDWQVVCGTDFGGSPGHPFTYLKFCQLPSGAWLMFHEYLNETGLLKDHAKAIKGSPLYRMQEANYSDWTAQDRKELKALGIRLMLANKDFDMSLDYVKSLFRGLPPREDPLLYFWMDDVEEFRPCKQAWQEFVRYNYPVGQDGKPISDKPIKVYDNAPDATRYALYTWKVKGSGFQYRTRHVDWI